MPQIYRYALISEMLKWGKKMPICKRMVVFWGPLNVKCPWVPMMPLEQRAQNLNRNMDVGSHCFMAAKARRTQAVALGKLLNVSSSVFFSRLAQSCGGDDV